jgi:hypothetical protein
MCSEVPSVDQGRHTHRDVGHARTHHLLKEGPKRPYPHPPAQDADAEPTAPPSPRRNPSTLPYVYGDAGHRGRMGALGPFIVNEVFTMRV